MARPPLSRILSFPQPLERTRIFVNTKTLAPVIAALACLVTVAGMLRAGPRESGTLESAADVLSALTTSPLKGIPLGLIRDAKGIAIIPGVIKAGFVIGGRHGRGVVLVRG